MFKILKKILGSKPPVNYKELRQRGAVILDVRTKSEFEGGHIAGALNIPVQVLENKLSSIPKGKPVITCCASGMRSATAKSILKAKGFEEVYNGGSWSSLNGALIE